jgi:DNA polymerase III sliding clamp (beta) subunit (PCNA family)
MKVNREELKNTLAAVAPGLASKDIIEQAQSFVFRENTVSTYNDEIAITAKTALDIEGAVKADEFHKLLNKSRAKEVDLEASGGELLIKTKSSRAGIRLEADVTLPLGEIPVPQKMYRLPEDFCEGVRFCLFCVSKDMTKPVLTALSVSDSVLSCDGYRLTQYHLDKGVKKPFLLPGAAASQLVKYSPTKYGVGDGWLHFTNENGVFFSCRTIDEEYPDLSHLIDVEGPKVEMPKRLADVLERAGIFAKAEFEQDERVRIILKEGKLLVKAKGAAGWYEEKCKADYDGEKVTFTIRPGFLKEMLNLLSVMVVGETSLKLEGEGFLHVLSLIVNEED